MRNTFATLEHKFAVRRREEVPLLFDPDKDTSVIQGPRYSPHLLSKHPVDLLLVEGPLKIPTGASRSTSWLDAVANTAPRSRPRLVIESWTASATEWGYRTDQ
uniref:Uncharacterized protein n=1 Tax=Grammatophora oceanica TaxID=210454 RepID=A0A7S1VAT0_9STRA